MVFIHFSHRYSAPGLLYLLIILYLISSVFGISTIAAGIGQYIAYFGISNVLLIEIAVIGAFCWLNISGISLSGMTENILTTLKIIPLVILSFLLIPFIKVDNFVPQTPVTVTGFLATIIIVYWPFTGFEISAIPVEETRDPKLIRRSLILVMGIVVSVYLLLNVALIGSVGAEALAASPAPLATAAAIVFDRSGVFNRNNRDCGNAFSNECLYNRNFPDTPLPVCPVFRSENSGFKPSGHSGVCTYHRLRNQRSAPALFQPF